MFRQLSILGLLTILTTGCGRFATDDQEAEALMAIANKAAATPVKAVVNEPVDTQVSSVLTHAFPSQSNVVFMASKAVTYPSSRGVTAGGVTPNGTSWVRNGGSWVNAGGDVVYGGNVKAQNPHTGGQASAGGLWIPGLGAIGYGAAYNPTTGQVGVGFCYGSAYYGSAGCYGCTRSGCSQAVYP